MLFLAGVIDFVYLFIYLFIYLALPTRDQNLVCSWNHLLVSFERRAFAENGSQTDRS
jgi:hypothetical protein